MRPPDTPQADCTRAERWQQKRRTELYKAAIGLIERHKAWWRTYNAYLNTDEWRHRRDLVFKRADGICEGCRQRSADQVHHLTYRNVYNEFIIQLVAMCTPCHERFHQQQMETQ